MVSRRDLLVARRENFYDFDLLNRIDYLFGIAKDRFIFLIHRLRNRATVASPLQS